MKNTVVLVVVSLMLVSVNAWGFDFDWEEYDLDGATVTFVFWGNLFPDDNLEMLQRKEMAEELFHCQIDMLVIGWGEVVEVLMTRLLSGETEYDIWRVGSDHFWPLVSQGAIFPAGDILPSGYYERLSTQTSVSTFRGTRYDFSDPHPGGGLHVLYWNKDLFARHDLPNLYELYESGQWTWDAMAAIATDATMDTTGDGQIDQWGLVNVIETTPFVGFSNNAAPTRVDENGRVYFAYEEEQAIETLRQIQNWVSVDRIAHGWGIDRFTQGKAAMAYDVLWTASTFKNNMEDEFGIVPFPLGPHGDGYRFPTRSAMSTVIPVNSAAPMTMIALYDYLFNDMNWYSPEDIAFALEDTIVDYVYDPESFEILYQAFTQWGGDATIFRVVTFPDFRWAYYDLGVNSNVHGSFSLQPAAAMQEVRPIIQSRLDELLDQ